MHYLEIRFSPVLSEEEQALLIAELLEAGFDSFSEEENVVLAYISSGIYNDNLLKDMAFLRNHPGVGFTVTALEDINWNKEWESNYQPVIIDEKCHVRAPFHPSLPGMKYEITIEPGMAFGTAHHETTRLMAGCLMSLDVRGKEVLDMGCGTGILAILANKMRASSVTGIDNDEWAWKNAMKNFTLNGMNAGCAQPGDAGLIAADRYDLILANINRNILLQDMEAYHRGLRLNGMMMLSGFYREDKEIIMEKASALGLHYISCAHENDWTIILLTK